MGGWNLLVSGQVSDSRAPRSLSVSSAHCPTPKLRIVSNVRQWLEVSPKLKSPFSEEIPITHLDFPVHPQSAIRHPPSTQIPRSQLPLGLQQKNSRRKVQNHSPSLGLSAHSSTES